MNKKIIEFTDAELDKAELAAFKNRENAKQVIADSEQVIHAIEAERSRRAESTLKEEKDNAKEE